MPRLQENKDLLFASPLPDDLLTIWSIHFSEQLGRPFHAELELTSANFDIDFSEIVGQNVTVAYTGGAEPRYFNGYVSRFSQSASRSNKVSYTATVVPFLWFLTRNADCRIFQNQSIPDIIKSVLQSRGFSDISLQLTGTYGPWEYCVQYRETDFNFISRLMEQEGIYYFFKHEDGKHTLVLIDDPSSHQPYPNYEEIAYRHASGDASGEFVRDWLVEQELQPGTFSLNDYDFTAPRKSLLSASKVQRTHAAADFEIYDYPGEYTDASDGAEYAKIRIQELQSQFEIIHASSDAAGICTGCTFSLTSFPRDDQNREYLITSASYQISHDEGEGGTGGGSASTFNCHFTAIDAKTPFRPARATPKPSVQGPQTAVVVGPSGQEIFTDTYGRVKVQFFWDRYGQADENSSCWVRVAQVWAGKKWGGMFIPRIGQEVIVEFLEGDPDQPIITGRVYNGSSTPPYDLPDNKTRSGIKTFSTPGGGGFNEIRFEDKKGSEQLFVHAEKNQDTRVKNDNMEWIGNDRHLIVTANQLEKVGANKHAQIKGDRLAKVEGDEGLTLTGDRLTNIGGRESLTVKGDRMELVKGDDSREVKGNLNEKVGSTVSMDAGSNLQQKVGQNFAVDAGMAIHIKGGMSVVIEAGMELTIKAGSNFINIGPAGVAIQGAMVMLNSGGAAGSGSGCQVTPPAPPVDPDAPKDAKVADDAQAGEAEDAIEQTPLVIQPHQMGPAALVLYQAAQDGKPFCAVCEAAKKAAQEKQDAGIEPPPPATDGDSAGDDNDDLTNPWSASADSNAQNDNASDDDDNDSSSSNNPDTNDSSSSSTTDNANADTKDAATKAADPKKAAAATADQMKLARKIAGDVVSGVGTLALDAKNAADKGQSFFTDIAEGVCENLGAPDVVKNLAVAAVKVAYNQAVKGGNLKSLGTDSVDGAKSVISPDDKKDDKDASKSGDKS